MQGVNWRFYVDVAPVGYPTWDFLYLVLGG